MAQIARRTDVIEAKAALAIPLVLGAICALGLSALLFIFRGDGMLLGLAWVLIVGAIAAIGYACYVGWLAKQETSHSFAVECVYCHERIELLEPPGDEDVTCTQCHRLIPMKNSVPLPVFEVRCGFCNTLNFYSDKSQFLICENCDREIPITTAEDLPQKAIPKGYVVDEDNSPYEVTLDAIPNAEHPGEDLIGCLQHMLALNRTQVKDLLANLPTTLLVGIPKKKAEMLRAQLTAHGATANYTQVKQ